jgi:hypothetical protein
VALKLARPRTAAEHHRLARGARPRAGTCAQRCRSLGQRSPRRAGHDHRGSDTAAHRNGAVSHASLASVRVSRCAQDELGVVPHVVSPSPPFLYMSTLNEEMVALANDRDRLAETVRKCCGPGAGARDSGGARAAAIYRVRPARKQGGAGSSAAALRGGGPAHIGDFRRVHNHAAVPERVDAVFAAGHRRSRRARCPAILAAASCAARQAARPAAAGGQRRSRRIAAALRGPAPVTHAHVNRSACRQVVVPAQRAGAVCSAPVFATHSGRALLCPRSRSHACRHRNKRSRNFHRGSRRSTRAWRSPCRPRSVATPTPPGRLRGSRCNSGQRNGSARPRYCLDCNT